MKTKSLGILTILIIISISAIAQKGYEKSIEFGGSIGLDNFTNYSYSIEMINGFRFNDYLFIGGGVGFRYTDALYFRSHIGSRFYESRDGKYLIPLYARLKANLTNANVSPFFLGNIGYTFDVGQNPNKNTYGLMIEPAFGIDFRLNDGRTGLYFLVGVNLQNAEYRYFGINSETIQGMATSISLRGGISF